MRSVLAKVSLLLLVLIAFFVYLSADRNSERLFALHPAPAALPPVGRPTSSYIHDGDQDGTISFQVVSPKSAAPLPISTPQASSSHESIDTAHLVQSDAMSEPPQATAPFIGSSPHLSDHSTPSDVFHSRTDAWFNESTLPQSSPPVSQFDPMAPFMQHHPPFDYLPPSLRRRDLWNGTHVGGTAIMVPPPLRFTSNDIAFLEKHPILCKCGSSEDGGSQASPASRICNTTGCGDSSQSCAPSYMRIRPRYAGMNNQLQDVVWGLAAARTVGVGMSIPNLQEHVLWVGPKGGWYPMSDYFNVARMEVVVPMISTDDWKAMCGSGRSAELLAHPDLHPYRDTPWGALWHVSGWRVHRDRSDDLVRMQKKGIDVSPPQDVRKLIEVSDRIPATEVVPVEPARRGQPPPPHPAGDDYVKPVEYLRYNQSVKIIDFFPVTQPRLHLRRRSPQLDRHDYVWPIALYLVDSLTDIRRAVFHQSRRSLGVRDIFNPYISHLAVHSTNGGVGREDGAAAATACSRNSAAVGIVDVPPLAFNLSFSWNDVMCFGVHQQLYLAGDLYGPQLAETAPMSPEKQYPLRSPIFRLFRQTLMPHDHIINFAATLIARSVGPRKYVAVHLRLGDFITRGFCGRYCPRLWPSDPTMARGVVKAALHGDVHDVVVAVDPMYAAQVWTYIPTATALLVQEGGEVGTRAALLTWHHVSGSLHNLPSYKYKDADAMNTDAWAARGFPPNTLGRKQSRAQLHLEHTHASSTLHSAALHDDDLGQHGHHALLVQRHTVSHSDPSHHLATSDDHGGAQHNAPVDHAHPDSSTKGGESGIAHRERSRSAVVAEVGHASYHGTSDHPTSSKVSTLESRSVARSPPPTKSARPPPHRPPPMAAPTVDRAKLEPIGVVDGTSMPLWGDEAVSLFLAGRPDILSTAEQWVCASATVFVGVSRSSWSRAVVEYRDLLGLPCSTSRYFNLLDGACYPRDIYS